MVNTDARISIGLPSHPKTKKLIKRLDYAGAWFLVRLLLWASQNRPSGDLKGMTDEDIELAVDWPLTTGQLMTALCETGFIDGTKNSRSIHQWAEHNPWAFGHVERSKQARLAGLISRYGKAKGASMFHAGQAVSQQAVNRQSTGSATPSPSPSPIPEPTQKEKTPAAASGAVTKSDGSLIWDAYAKAFSERYGQQPPRSASVNSKLAQFSKRLPASEAPRVAAFYVSHNGAFYVAKVHPVGLLLADAEKLRTEWAMGRTVNAHSARLNEKTEANPFAKLLREEIEKEKSNVIEN